MDVQVHPQFRHRLRELRQAAGLSLRELGKLVSYSHSYLWELEAGSKQPSATAAARLDRALSAGGNLTTLVAARPVLPTLGGAAGLADDGLEFPPDWRQGIAAIEMVADRATDEETRSWLRRMAGYLGSAGRDLLVDVAAAAITKGSGLG